MKFPGELTIFSPVVWALAGFFCLSLCLGTKAQTHLLFRIVRGGEARAMALLSSKIEELHRVRRFPGPLFILANYFPLTAGARPS